MKVILREPVESLGHIGDEVVVADGYARNYLLPKNKVFLATDANRKLVEKDKKRYEALEENARAQARSIAEKVEGLVCKIPAKVSEGDKLYGSVASRDIAQWLKGQGVEISKSMVLLEEPIKTIGTYTVPLQFHRDVTSQLSVEVVPDQDSE